MYKMNLEHLAPQKKKVRGKTLMMGYVRTEEPPGGALSDQNWDNLNKKLTSIGL